MRSAAACKLLRALFAPDGRGRGHVMLTGAQRLAKGRMRFQGSGSAAGCTHGLDSLVLAGHDAPQLPLVITAAHSSQLTQTLAPHRIFVIVKFRPSMRRPGSVS